MLPGEWGRKIWCPVKVGRSINMSCLVHLCDCLARRRTLAASWQCARCFAQTFASVVFIIFCTACTHPVLGKPALLGASVTAGAGAAVAPGRPFNTISTADLVSGASCSACAGTGLAVDAGIAYSAVVTVPHDVPRNYGDGATFIDPLGALHEQAVSAAKDRPTVVIAVDWLFWPVHQSIPLDVLAAERDAQRLANVDAALAELDRFDCPIVIGDVPDMKHAQGGLLKESHDPGARVRAQANQRLTDWAAERPNRFVLNVSAFADAVNSGAAIEIAGFIYPAGESVRLLQRDGLHATPEGLAVLVAAAVHRLHQAGLVEKDACECEMSVIAATVEQEAAAAKHRARPQMFDAMSVATLAKRFRDAFSYKNLSVDDAAAAEALEQLLTRLESFSCNPAGEMGWVVDIGFGFTALDLNDAPVRPVKTLAVFAKHWQRLKADALADTPDPWHFDLWLKYASQPVPNLAAQTIDLLVERRRERAPLTQPYASLVWNFAQDVGGTALARCFPDSEEAYEVARAVSPKRYLSWGDQPTSKFGLWGLAQDATGFVRYLESRKAAGLPDISQEFRARAEADGFKGAFKAVDRSASIEVASHAMYPRWPAIWWGPTIPVGSEIIRFIDHPQVGVKPDLSMRAPFAESKVWIVRPWLGFGWMENLDGAAVVVTSHEGWTHIITRAVIQPDGSVGLESGHKALTPAATVWYDIGHTDCPPMSGMLEWHRVGLPIPLEVPVDREGFVSKVRQVAIANASMHGANGANETNQPDSHDPPETVIHWPIGVRAAGRVSRATVRIPMGWDDAGNAPRWAIVEIIDQSVLLLGVLEREDGLASVDGACGDDLAQLERARLRLHAVWRVDGPKQPDISGLAGDRATGEIVSMDGFVLGRAEELSRAIQEKVDAAAEVQMWWRPKPVPSTSSENLPSIPSTQLAPPS